MTGKKITNVGAKNRHQNYPNANNSQMISTGKSFGKHAVPSPTVRGPNGNGDPLAIPTTNPDAMINRNQQPNLSTLIKMQENSKYLPRYSVALTKFTDDLYPADELDSIQLELELLLSTVALRYRKLKSEFDALEDKSHKKHNASTSNSQGKRKRDDGNKKTTKETKTSTQTSKVAKAKASNSPAHIQQTDDNDLDAVPSSQQNSQQSNGQTNPKVLVPKNDIPNKFWLSVEPYCMPITQEDIKLLDDLIEEYSGPLVPPIPELGAHYTTRWAAEDLRDEQDNSNQNAKANKRFTNAVNAEVTNMLKKGEKILGEGVTGPLTQRLVAALLEENLLQSDVLGISDGTSSVNNESNDSCGENNSSSANRMTSLLRNGIDVELRLKKELIELGILEDFSKEKDDEVLSEIKRVRTELQSIAEYNFNELKQLQAAAREEMKRLEIKRKLDLVDQEVGIADHKRL